MRRGIKVSEPIPFSVIIATIAAILAVTAVGVFLVNKLKENR